jgi:hypothetical protein
MLHPSSPDEPGGSQDPASLIAESRFVAARLTYWLRVVRMKRWFGAFLAYLLIALCALLIWAYLKPGTPPISGVAWELVPALALVCAYGAFEAVRYVLTLSSMAQEMRALSDYQVTVTRAAEDALPEASAK